jgi:hypothetical protein
MRNILVKASLAIYFIVLVVGITADALAQFVG